MIDTHHIHQRETQIKQQTPNDDQNLIYVDGKGLYPKRGLIGITFLLPAQIVQSNHDRTSPRELGHCCPEFVRMREGLFSQSHPSR